MTSLEFQCRHRFPSGFVLDLQFTAGAGVTALLGPSGCGKTTVLNMIAGLLQPVRGRIELGTPGRVVLDTEANVCWPPRRRGVGYVFQEHRLFPHLTVAGNLRYGMRRAHRGLDREPVTATSAAPVPRVAFDRVVKVLELEAFLARYPRHLSGGESQRVSLGRALLSGPEILLMDEPLTGLDERLRQRVLTYLERVLDEWRLPTLLVSHAQADVRRLADRLVVLEQGRLVVEGSTDDALTHPALLSWSAPGGPVNLLRVEIRDRGAMGPGGDIQAELGSQVLHLPSSPVRHGTVFVEFGPRDVMLSRGDVTGLSARNHLRGTVRRLIETPAGVFVAIEMGPLIWAEITPAALSELRLAVGDDVVCLIKTHSLKVWD